MLIERSLPDNVGLSNKGFIEYNNKYIKILLIYDS